MSRYDEVKRFIEDNSESKLLSKEYKNNITKMLFKCKCGRTFETCYSTFRSGNKRTCSVCSGSKYDIEYIREFVKNNSSCELVSEVYVDSKLPLTYKCACGNLFTIKFDHFRGSNVRQCNDCGYDMIREKLARTTSEFIDVVANLVGNEYQVLSEYINANVKIKFKHKTCGDVFYMTPGSFTSGSRCPKCVMEQSTLNQTKPHDVYAKEVSEEYDLLEKYIGAHKKIMVRHKKCGHVWSVSPNAILRRGSCPNCKESRGERSIKEWLKENKIKYKREKKFKDCKHIESLRFDFFLPNKNILIEYDGRQHFEPIPFGGVSEEQAAENLKSVKFRDSIKNKYCKDNNIKLIRIPYWDIKNIDTILRTNLI